MQIYEITGKKRINEVQGIIGGLASTIAKGAIKSVLGPGVDAAFKGQGGDTGQAAAMAQSKTLIGPMSDQAQKVWLQTLQKMIATSVKPVTSVTELDQTVVKEELQSLIDRLTKVDTRRWATLTNETDPTGQKRQTAKVLDAASAEVVKQSMSGTTQGLPAAWDKLAEYIVQAQNAEVFNQNQSSVITLSAGAKKIADSLRLDDGDIVKIRQAIGSPNGDQIATVILDKTTLATIASPLIKRFGQQTKLTDTELASIIALAQDAANDAAFNEIFGLRA